MSNIFMMQYVAFFLASLISSKSVPTLSELRALPSDLNRFS